MHRIALAFAAATALSFAGTAQASIIIDIEDYTVSGPLTGTFKILVDDSLNTSISDVNLMLGTSSFNSSNTGYIDGFFFREVGGTLSGVDTVDPTAGGPDFRFVMSTAQSETDTIIYVLAGTQQTLTGDETVSRVSEVPEPASWVMMLLGFVAIGFAVKRGRRPALASCA
jgi:hypothetical protein